MMWKRVFRWLFFVVVWGSCAIILIHACCGCSILRDARSRSEQKEEKITNKVSVVSGSDMSRSLSEIIRIDTTGLRVRITTTTYDTSKAVRNEDGHWDAPVLSVRKEESDLSNKTTENMTETANDSTKIDVVVTEKTDSIYESETNTEKTSATKTSYEWMIWSFAIGFLAAIFISYKIRRLCR